MCDWSAGLFLLFVAKNRWLCFLPESFRLEIDLQPTELLMLNL
jgi:hypothetical protein